ncbi:HAMP domain-containing protein [Amycolatopsis orientalis]|uniref:HAMP domain-containing protein n=1 Tax=Amycolatopsis orientalis TaxID=31958 RepID=UPI0004174BA4|nr:HAMP domain-containing protein [Amycolatopsis orientalis]
MNRQKDQLDSVARLRDQIPEAGFPRGVGVASATGFVLLLLITAFTALYLSTSGPLSAIGGKSGDLVPDEVTEGQRRATVALAQALATSATTAAGDLQVSTGSGVFDNADDDAVLNRLGETYPDWRGIVVFDPAARKVLATHGEPVAVENLRDVAVSNLTVRPIARPGDSPLVLTALPLTGARAGKLLVVSTALRGVQPELDKEAKQQIRLVTPDGALLYSYGAEVPENDRTAQELLTRAAAAGAAGESGAFTGDATAEPAEPDRRIAPVVSFAPITSDGTAGSLGLTAVTISRFPVEPVPARRPGLIPAAALLVLAIGGFVLLRRTVVAPILRLRADALAVAAGVLDRPVRQSRVHEVNRLTRAVERYRSKLRRRKIGAKVKPFISAQAVVALVSLALLGWSVTIAATLGRQNAAVSPTVLSEYNGRVTHSADTLRRSLSQGLGDLRAVARLSAGKQPEQLRGMLEQLAMNESRFRSVYLTDADGGVLQSAGREALRDPGKLPDGAGLRQHNTSGRVPVVYAFTRLPDSAQVLVGEYDVPRMASMLGSAGGRVRVVDEGKRTIADTEGYFAFSQLTDPVLVKNVTTAQTGEDARETTPTTLVAAERLADEGSVAELKWVVVAEQPIGSLGVADNTVRAGARVAALLTAVVALMLFAWHLLVVIRPLRRVAESAVPIAKGVGMGAVVYPQRQDEIGSIASCVEICRQALTEGKARLGEVRRPAGAATDETALLQRVKDAPETERRPEPRVAPRRPARSRPVVPRVARDEPRPEQPRAPRRQRGPGEGRQPHLAERGRSPK